MAHSEPWARRLVNKLGKLAPEAVLQRKSFQDPTFLRFFFDWLDERIYQDPQAGLSWAMVVPQLALRTPEEDGGRQEHRENLVKAYAILGGAYRTASRPDDAEESYRIALKIAEAETISPAARADLNQRLSVLLICQGRLDEAESRLSGDLAVFELDHQRADVLLKRGTIHRWRQRYAEAIDCFGQALQLADPKASTSAARVHHCTVHNMAYAVLHVTSTSIERPEVWVALRYVRAARLRIRGQRDSIPRHKLQWVESLIWKKLGMWGKAEVWMKAARRGFVRLRAPWEIALVSLDLLDLLVVFEQWNEVEAVAADTLERFRILSGNTKTVLALSVLVAVARERVRDTPGSYEKLTAAIAVAQELAAARMARP